MAALVMPESPEMSLPHERDVISYELSEPQTIQVKKLLQEYADVFSGNPNVTNPAIHQIDTGDSRTNPLFPIQGPAKTRK